MFTSLQLINGIRLHWLSLVGMFIMYMSATVSGMFIHINLVKLALSSTYPAVHKLIAQ